MPGVSSAQNKAGKQKSTFNDIDKEINDAVRDAAYRNANTETTDTFCRKTQNEREMVDAKLGELRETLNDIQTSKEQECYSGYPQEIHHRLKKKWAHCECPQPDSFNGVEVPKNIEHSFKTHEIKDVLSDPEKVEQARSQYEANLKSQVKTDLVTRFNRDAVKIPSGDAIYYELSSALRSSTFPGYSWDQTYGVEKSTYTNEPFKRQAALAPRPDSQEAKMLEKYKYKADNFTRWRESFFLREQQAKKWNSVQQDKKGGGS